MPIFQKWMKLSLMLPIYCKNIVDVRLWREGLIIFSWFQLFSGVSCENIEPRHHWQHETKQRTIRRGDRTLVSPGHRLQQSPYMPLTKLYIFPWWLIVIPIFLCKASYKCWKLVQCRQKSTTYRCWGKIDMYTQVPGDSSTSPRRLGSRRKCRNLCC